MLQSVRALPSASVVPVAVVGTVVGLAAAAGVGMGVVVANRVPLTVINRCPDPLVWTPPPVVGAVLPTLDVPPGGQQTLRVPRVTVTLRQEGSNVVIQALGREVTLPTPNLTSLELDGVSLLEGGTSEVALGEPRGHTLTITCRR